MRTVAVSLFLLLLSANAVAVWLFIFLLSDNAYAETRAECIASARADRKVSIKSAQATFLDAKAECKSSGGGGGGVGNTCPCSCAAPPTSCHDGDPACDVD